MTTEVERIAPEGKVWVCLACGKVSTDLYGIKGFRSYGWDVSCSLNAELRNIDDIEFDFKEVATA